MSEHRQNTVERELEFHLEQQTAAHVAAGMSRAAAERQARLEFGGVAQLTEACRDVQRWRTLATLWADIRSAVRLAARTPALTLTIVLTLALGIGANSAIFSVVYGVLLKPLPYAHPERLVMLWNTNAHDAAVQSPVSPANYRDYAAESRSFERLEAYFSFVSALELGIDNHVEVTYASTVTPGLFDLLGRRAALGRTFHDGDSDYGVVISDGYWRRRFGANPAVVGTRVTVGGIAAAIIGVMPADFVFPYRGMLGPTGFTRSTAVDLWAPMLFTGPAAVQQRTVDESGQVPRNVRWLGVIGRLKPAVSVAQASADAASVARRLEQAYPDANRGWGLALVTASDQTVGSVRPALLLLLAGVALVLLIAAVNVANLMLARSLARHKEQSTRVALGAARGRLLQQSIVESLVLAVAGGGLGLLLMSWSVRVLTRMAPAELPRVHEIAPDWRVAIVTLTVAIVTGVAVGVLPALHAASANPQQALQEQGRAATGSRRQRRYRSTLVLVEVALALVLTVGATLLLRSFTSVLNVNPGFDPDHLLTWQMNLPARLQTAEARRAFYQEFFARMSRLPGVVAVGGTTRLPLGSTSVTTTVAVQSKPRPAADLPEVEFRRSVGDYFTAMRIPVLRGRAFTADDGPNAPPVAVINQTMARRLFGDENPIGQRIRTGPAQTGPWSEIVGVIGDIRHTGLEQAPAPEMYISYLQNPPVSPFIVIRTAGDPGALADAVRAEARAFDKDLPLFDMRTMTEIRSESVAQRRFVVLLVGVFGLLALVLAAVGVDGVMAVSVTERVDEMGVRLALGAEPRQVITMVVAQAARLTLAGVAVGLLLSSALMPLLRTELFGTEPIDPATFTIVPAVLFLVAMAATVLPARRAAHVDPVHVLRKV